MSHGKLLQARSIPLVIYFWQKQQQEYISCAGVDLEEMLTLRKQLLDAKGRKNLKILYPEIMEGIGVAFVNIGIKKWLFLIWVWSRI